MPKILTTAVFLTACVASFGKSTSVDRIVTACTEGGAGFLAQIHAAQMTASMIFEGIGVNVRWRRSLSGCPQQAIRISLNQKTTKVFRDDVLAFARPYEGVDIQVFYDRIATSYEPGMIAIVLAHVMAHEIAHLVEGIDRHSDQGIMKAHWDSNDLFYMQVHRLRFAAEDINLINRGLARPAPWLTTMLQPTWKPVAER